MRDGVDPQGRLAQLEKELDWVKAERDEAVATAAEVGAKAKEAESAGSRAKTLRREDIKRAAKEKVQLADRAEVRLWVPYLSTIPIAQQQQYHCMHSGQHAATSKARVD